MTKVDGWDSTAIYTSHLPTLFMAQARARKSQSTTLDSMEEFVGQFSDTMRASKDAGIPFFIRGRKEGKGISISMLNGDTGKWHWVNYDRNTGGYILGQEQKQFGNASRSESENRPTNSRYASASRGDDKSLEARFSKMETLLSKLVDER